MFPKSFKIIINYFNILSLFQFVCSNFIYYLCTQKYVLQIISVAMCYGVAYRTEHIATIIEDRVRQIAANEER